MPLARYVLIRWVPASGCSVQNVPECPNPGRTTWRPFGRCRRGSSVAACGGVAKSSSPPMRSVSTFDARTMLYSSSSATAGQESPSRPFPQLNVVAASPRFAAGFRLPEEKDSVAAAASSLPAAAICPQTNDSGTRKIGKERLEPEPARVAVGGGKPRVQRYRAGEGPSAASDVVSMSP